MHRKAGLRLTKQTIIPRVLWIKPGFVILRSKPFLKVWHDVDSTTAEPAIQKNSSQLEVYRSLCQDSRFPVV